MITRVNLNCS